MQGGICQEEVQAFDSFEKIVVENRLLEVISVMVKGCTEVVVSVSGRSDGCI